MIVTPAMSANMKQPSIKVIKKRARSAVKPAAARTPAAPADREGNDGNMADTVKNWIGERRANRKAEGAFSDTQLTAWKAKPDTADNVDLLEIPN